MQKKYFYKKYKNLKKTYSSNIFKKNNLLYYQIRSLNFNFVNKNNFEALRRILSRKIKKKMNFLIYKNSNKIPVFKKPLKVRMGSGKAGFNEWLWKIQKHQKIFDISYFNNNFLIEKYFKKIKKKLPCKIYITKLK